MSRKISQYFDYKIDGKEFKIRYKIPTVGEQISIGQMYATYKSGLVGFDQVSDTLAYTIACLNNVIVDKPSDLRLEDVSAPDWSVLRQMYSDYQSFAFFRPENSEQSSDT
jgi:hypothetical protein